MKCSNCGLDIHASEPVRLSDESFQHLEYRCVYLLKKRIEFLEKEIRWIHEVYEQVLA